MKVTVSKLCSGHARCFDLAPEVYDIDENGYNADIGKTVAVVAGHERQAVRGAKGCPERAIVVESEE